MSFPYRQYEELNFSNLTPAALSEWSQLGLSYSIDCIYQFVGATIARTAGLASGTIAPVFSNSPITPTSGRTVFIQRAATAYAGYPGNYLVITPEFPILFRATGFMYCAITPDVFGDTFAISLRLNRVQ